LLVIPNPHGEQPQLNAGNHCWSYNNGDYITFGVVMRSPLSELIT
jgi:hypothetical protein